MKTAMIILTLALLAGCTTTYELPTVEPWEGRYPTVEEFHEKTSDIQLKDGQ